MFDLSQPRPLELPLEDIPGPEAEWPDMLEFALTYNAYDRIASEPRALGNVVQPVLQALDDAGTVPEWAQLDLLRATLFFVQRASRHMEDYGPRTEHRFRLLIEAITKVARDPLVVDEHL